MAWLQRAAQAARQASYEGVYVHTNGDRISTVRVTHITGAGEEHERIEPLDGPDTLEIVRRNDEMYCRFPDAKTVRLDPRITNRFFPGILAAPAETIAASYDVKLGKTERVLGYECQWIRLDPKDGLRFPQRVCSEMNSGLVLRAKVLNGERQVIEQYSFTDLKLGPQVGRTDLKSIFRARNRQWLSDGSPRDEASNAETGWAVTRAPAGFNKVAELKRTLPGRSQPVSQIVLTDGLATLSVFVEPNPSPPRTAEASSEDGTTTFFVRPMGDQLVTVLGEVPLATAQQVARSVSRR
jgi:sigma-E factor negative regulatory protein RseB